MVLNLGENMYFVAATTFIFNGQDSEAMGLGEKGLSKVICPQ